MFRVEQHRALLAKTANLIDQAGTVDVPAAKRGMAWDEVRRNTRRARVEALLGGQTNQEINEKLRFPAISEKVRTPG